MKEHDNEGTVIVTLVLNILVLFFIFAVPFSKIAGIPIQVYGVIISFLSMLANRRCRMRGYRSRLLSASRVITLLALILGIIFAIAMIDNMHIFG